MIAGGALVGTIWLARAPIVRVGPGTMAIFTTLLLAVVLLGIAAAPTMTVAFVLALVFGFVQAPQLTGVFQVRDRESPQQARSLVFATAASLRTGAFAIGSLTAGALVDSGWRPIFVAAALTQILSVALGLLFAARQHRRPNSR